MLRISQVGLRGVVGDGLSASHVLDFSSAFGTFVDPGRPVLVCRDPRASGIMLREGVLAGLLACGHRVIDIGVASTPVMQHAIRRERAAGGISIGASHNSAEWNALKFFGPRGAYLSTAESNELLDIYHLRKFRFSDWRSVGTLTCVDDAIDTYLEELASVFPFDRLKRFRVVVDCCSGTSSLLLRRLNDRYGFDFILINQKPEGRRFAHDPLITPDTIGLQLAPLMQPLKADAGFLFDVDSDRVGIATEKGMPVSEELILPMLADHLLPKAGGKILITNLSTTALVEEVAARHGGRVLRVPVGRQSAIDALSGYRADQIALAGEGTGAVMMPQFEFAYDGIASMLAILEMMNERGQSLQEIVSGYPRYFIMKAQVPLSTAGVPALMMELQQLYADGRANVLDGLRVDWPGRWFHVRVSQTEPIIRIICEQRDEPPRQLMNDLLEHVRSAA